MIFLIGVAAWTFLEYLIHAWLSHIFTTFATPLHQVHHRDPHAVFTIGAWIPVALTWIGGIAIFGFASGMIFYTGMTVGFIAYELIHYRLHFAAPSGPVEAYLRNRHLVHHFRDPRACFGVTSGLWDLVFGTEPFGKQMSRMIETVKGVPPLDGRSNIRRIFYFGIPASRR